MKKFSLVILFVLLSVSAFCYEKPFIESIKMNFEDGSIGDWKINPDYSYGFSNEYLTMSFNSELQKVVIATFEYDRQYNFVLNKKKKDYHTTYSLKAYSNGNNEHYATFWYKIYVAYDNGLIYEGKAPEPFEVIEKVLSNGTENRYDFTDKYGENVPDFLPNCYFIYKIEIIAKYVNGSDEYPINFKLKSSDLEHLFYMNPEYDGLIEAKLQPKVVNFTHIDLMLNMYYGLESQMVDVYIVAYSNNQLFFFPEWATDVYKTTMWLPKYTICNYLILGEWLISGLPFDTKNCEYYIGISPQGTLDFLNVIE